MNKNKILTKTNILHLANLSRLKLTEDEINKYWSQLEDTVEYVKNLEELDTKNILPTSQTTNLSNVGFDDGEINTRALTQIDATKNAKNTKKGYFVVNRIMQE